MDTFTRPDGDNPESARIVSRTAHQAVGQVDKAGRPYWEHPDRVAKNARNYADSFGIDEERTRIAECAAYLHDVVEDTQVTSVDLAAMGFGLLCIETVQLLTKPESPDGSPTDLTDYYAAIATHSIARIVKLADIADNANPARQAALKPANREQLAAKYTKSIDSLGVTSVERQWLADLWS